MGDLAVVEALLTKLDAGDVRTRRSVVLRLKNSPATDVANTLNTYLTTQRTFDQSAPGLTSVYEEFEREVAIVPEPVTNSLVLSATPRFFDEVKSIIEQLDARPLMVTIQVLIASIDLGDTNEFGIEVGLQDSTLFDRSILSNPLTTTTTLPTGTSTQTVIAADVAPGFNFNDTSNPLGNSGQGTNLSPTSVAGQSLTNFGVGRQDTDAGLRRTGPLGAKPEREPRCCGPWRRTIKSKSWNGRKSPRSIIRPPTSDRPARADDLQRQQQRAYRPIEHRHVPERRRDPRRTAAHQPGRAGRHADRRREIGTGTGGDGHSDFQLSHRQITRSPIIDSTTAQTTVSAMDGQTIVLGGLISKTKNESHRSVPWLGDLPLIGNLFRYDSTSCERTELLIILTPHIIRTAADAEALKRDEAAKMSWCLCDVTKIHGEAGTQPARRRRARPTSRWFIPIRPADQSARRARRSGSGARAVGPTARPGGGSAAQQSTDRSHYTADASALDAAAKHSRRKTRAPPQGSAPLLRLGRDRASPGDPISGTRYYGPAPAGDFSYPPARGPQTVEQAGYQRPDAYYQTQTNPGAPQPAVYQQPAGPAPYQPQFDR